MIDSTKQPSENPQDQTPSFKTYAEAMQDYLSRPAKPLKKPQENYPPRELLSDRCLGE